MLDDLFIPHPPAGDSSNRIPTTGWVGTAIAAGSLASVAGLSVLGNASTATATPLAIKATASSQFPFTNAAFTTIVWGTISTFLDSAVGSTQGAVLSRNAASWVATTAAGAMTLLNTLLPNGVASVVDTTSISSTYANYEIAFDAVNPDQAANLQMLIATVGTAFQTSGYVCINDDYVNGTAATSTFTSAIQLTAQTIATSSGRGFQGVLRAGNLAATGFRKHMSGFGGYQNSIAATGTASFALAKFGGMFNASSPIVSIAFQMSTGNIATGVIKIYGMT